MEDFINKFSCDQTNGSVDITQVVSELQNLLVERCELQADVSRLKAHNAQIEETHQQELHVLRARLQNLEQMEPEYREEIASLQRDKTAIAVKMEEAHHTQSLQYKDEIHELNSRIEQLQYQLTVSEGQIIELEEKLALLPSNTTTFGNDTSLFGSAEECFALKEQITMLEEEKQEILVQYRELVESHDEMKRHLNKDLMELTQERDFVILELNEYVRALEREREGLVECQAEMETLKMEQDQPAQKGNSLYAELDDRRIKAEKKLALVMLKLEGMKRELTGEKILRHKLKVEMSSMLNANNSRYTDHHVERLNSIIVQVKADKQRLMDRLQDSERTQKQHLKKFTQVQMAEECEKDKEVYSFLSEMIGYKESQIDELKAEMTQVNIALMIRTEKTQEYHRKLVECENEIGQLKNDISKKDLDMDELKLELVKVGKDDPMKQEEKPDTQYIEKLSFTTDETTDRSYSADVSHAFDGTDVTVSGADVESVDSDSKFNNIRSPLRDLNREGTKPHDSPSLGKEARKTKRVNIAESCTVVEYQCAENDDSSAPSDNCGGDLVYSDRCDTSDRNTTVRRARGRKVHPVIKQDPQNAKKVLKSSDCKQQ